MKKFLSFILIFAMIFSFAGCSGEKEFVPERGTVSENVYENAAFGIKYNAGENWYFYSDEEIASTMGATMETVFPEETAEALAAAELIYDMYCTDTEKGSTVNVNYENMGLAYGSILDEKSYLEISASGIAEVFESAGVEVIRNEIGTTVVDGKEIPCAYVTISVYGMDFYEILVAKKVENWMGVVTLASFTEDELATMLGNLSLE